MLILIETSEVYYVIASKNIMIINFIVDKLLYNSSAIYVSKILIVDPCFKKAVESTSLSHQKALNFRFILELNKIKDFMTQEKYEKKFPVCLLNWVRQHESNVNILLV